MAKKAVFFGELLMRLETKGFKRFVQAREFDAYYTGAEANAAVALQSWGVDTYLVSAVPSHEMGDACINTFRAFGVNTDSVLRRGNRLGTFYLEQGAAQRASKVIYDRAHSSFAELQPGKIPWNTIFREKDWFHVSGTGPALTRDTADAVAEACEQAQACGVRVSMDLNFRSSLWQWDPDSSPTELAGRTIRSILSHVNLIIANWGQASDVLGIRMSTDSGVPTPDQHSDIARRIAAESENIEAVALTMRESVSASRCRWGAMLYIKDTDTSLFSPEANGLYTPYEIMPIVDRVGSGDSFAAGLIRGYLLEKDMQEMLDFAVAVSCLKHSIPGDFTIISETEAEELMKGDRSGRIRR